MRRGSVASASAPIAVAAIAAMCSGEKSRMAFAIVAGAGARVARPLAIGASRAV
jgi:hypothetical protein